MPAPPPPPGNTHTHLTTITTPLYTCWPATPAVNEDQRRRDGLVCLWRARGCEARGLGGWVGWGGRGSWEGRTGHRAKMTPPIDRANLWRVRRSAPPPPRCATPPHLHPPAFCPATPPTSTTLHFHRAALPPSYTPTLLDYTLQHLHLSTYRFLHCMFYINHQHLHLQFTSS